MLNLWNTPRSKKEGVYEEGGQVDFQHSWIGLSTSSKPGKNQGSGIRELQKWELSLPDKPKSTP